jgi:hypothetical protein
VQEHIRELCASVERLDPGLKAKALQQGSPFRGRARRDARPIAALSWVQQSRETIGQSCEMKRQAGRRVGHPEQQPATAFERKCRVSQNLQLSVRLEVVEHVQNDDYIGFGQHSPGYIPGLNPNTTPERYACPLGNLVLQLDSAQTQIRRRRRPGCGPDAQLELAARGEQHRSEQALPAAEIDHASAIGNQAATQERDEYRVESQLVSREVVRIPTGCQKRA